MCVCVCVRMQVHWMGISEMKPEPSNQTFGKGKQQKINNKNLQKKKNLIKGERKKIRERKNEI